MSDVSYRWSMKMFPFIFILIIRASNSNCFGPWLGISIRYLSKGFQFKNFLATTTKQIEPPCWGTYREDPTLFDALLMVFITNQAMVIKFKFKWFLAKKITRFDTQKQTQNIKCIKLNLCKVWSCGPSQPVCHLDR